MIGKRPRNVRSRIPLGVLKRRVQELAHRKEAVQHEVADLSQLVAEQTKHLNSLASKVEMMTRREDDLRAKLGDTHDRFLRRDDEIQSTMYDFQATLAAVLHRDAKGAHASSREGNEGSVPDKAIDYQQLVRRIREIVRDTLPRNATVIVASEGDNELLDLYRRQSWHFPRTEDGAYAGYYPPNDAAAVIQLEALRAKGGEYLLFPAPALRWLEHRVKFKQHLERHYRVVVSREDTCTIFALHESPAADNAAWWTELEETIGEFRIRFGREPAILDCNTKMDLAARFPHHTVFSPVAADDPGLPYLDSSIDVSAVSNSDPVYVREATRVANAAVVTFNGEPAGEEAGIDLEVTWKSGAATAISPTTSIVIPTYNGIAHLDTCLTALREALPSNFRGQIIVVDDASGDETRAGLKRWAKLYKRLKVMRNRRNSGFITSCNRGAKAATGEVLIFLNDDTLPQRGWLPPLLQIFDNHANAGVVGGKLVYPDGRLQEAGGVVFSDCSGANFGKFDPDINAPVYNYVRQVDYCSGALLATKRSLFLELGGFDTYFQPAYYEDADYCFKLREKGYRVYYQPESTVIHLEGATSGTDLSRGIKRYQAVNRAKFARRWGEELKRQPNPPKRFDHATWHALAVRDRWEGAEEQ